MVYTYLRGWHICSPNTGIYYILRCLGYTVFFCFFWLKWVPDDELTQNIGFSFPFHLYIHDHNSNWAGCTPTWGADTYVPPIQAFCYILQLVFSYLVLAQMDASWQTNTKSWFYHSFLPVHSWSWLWTNCWYIYLCTEHVCTLDIGK